MTKQQRSEIAYKHHNLMLEKHLNDMYSNAIYTGFDCIDYEIFHVRESPIQVDIMPYDIITAMFKYHKENYDPKEVTMVLNFASYTNPGGGFLNGAVAQEECLCMFSNLYEVLSREQAFYNYNRQHTHDGAYEHRAIVSRNLPFEQFGKQFNMDVLTCAAPNLNYQKTGSWNNNKILKERIKFILDIAEFEAIDVLFLGAWGCGVFKQDATNVATLFKEVLNENKHYNFSKIIFAIPPGENLDKFKNVYNDCRWIN